MFEQISLGRDGVTPEQVGNVYFLDIVDLYPATGQIHETRDATNVQRKAFEKPENLATAATV
ncbi:hypothetical protein D9M71_407700 [compost metagenome]